MKFHTTYRPGDLVRDKETGDKGVIVKAETKWKDKYGAEYHRKCTKRKNPGEIDIGGIYGIFPKTEDSVLNGCWYDEKDLELVKKGFLH